MLIAKYEDKNKYDQRHGGTIVHNSDWKTIMAGFKVLLNGEEIDTVFFNKGCDEEYVKESLVNHDGYPSDIEVIIEG